MNGQIDFPWEREAMNGDGMPDRLSLADQMAYTALRNIYWLYRERWFSREQASAEKKKLHREWEKARAVERFDRELTERHARQIKAQEQAVSICRKHPTPENAINLCNILDGLATVPESRDQPPITSNYESMKGN